VIFSYFAVFMKISYRHLFFWYHPALIGTYHQETHSNTGNTAFILAFIQVFNLVNIFKEVKSLPYFLTTTAECSVKHFDTQCSHTHFLNWSALTLY